MGYDEALLPHGVEAEPKANSICYRNVMRKSSRHLYRTFFTPKRAIRTSSEISIAKLLKIEVGFLSSLILPSLLIRIDSNLTGALYNILKERV
jgi:hypothetical protein